MQGLLALVLLAAQPLSLQVVAERLQSSPAWRAGFEQRYIPAGFDDGAVETGTVVARAPRLIRFDYSADAGRVFAFDGEVARMVDYLAGTCDATRLDPASAGSLPLAVLIDPSSANDVLVSAPTAELLVLTPRLPTPDVAEIRIAIGRDGLPALFVVIDGAGNRNEFSFSSWTRSAAPAISFFQPGLTVAEPCQPRGG